MSALGRGCVETRRSDIAGPGATANLADSLLAGADSRVEAVWSVLELIVSSIRRKHRQQRAYAPTICIALIVLANPRMLTTLLRL